MMCIWIALSLVVSVLSQTPLATVNFQCDQTSPPEHIFPVAFEKFANSYRIGISKMPKMPSEDVIISASEGRQSDLYSAFFTKDSADHATNAGCYTPVIAFHPGKCYTLGEVLKDKISQKDLSEEAAGDYCKQTYYGKCDWTEGDRWSGKDCKPLVDGGDQDIGGHFTKKGDDDKCTYGIEVTPCNYQNFLLDKLMQLLKDDSDHHRQRLGCVIVRNDVSSISNNPFEGAMKAVEMKYAAKYAQEYTVIPGSEQPASHTGVSMSGVIVVFLMMGMTSAISVFVALRAVRAHYSLPGDGSVLVEDA